MLAERDILQQTTAVILVDCRIVNCRAILADVSDILPPLGKVFEKVDLGVSQRENIGVDLCGVLGNFEVTA